MKIINVTETFLPPIEEYQKMLEPLWESRHVTNQGKYVQELDKQLKGYLEVPYFSFVSNGTMAIQIALRALGITEGEIITTPFSYVATATSILWENCKPVFVDIDPATFCMNPLLIEQSITPRTRAILPVHVYGLPCDVQKIGEISQKYGLPVIYDAAHAFGVRYKGRSLLDYGEIATCSFHATKLFHTVEGGAIVSHDEKVANAVDLLRRFGHTGDEYFCLGINGKNSEFHAAMGLLNYKYLPQIIRERKLASDYYDSQLGTLLARPLFPEGLEYNFAYYPVITESKDETHAIIQALNKVNIFPRRYFYPSLNTLHYVNGESCPASEEASSRVLCLPLFAGLSEEDQELICKTILDAR